MDERCLWGRRRFTAGVAAALPHLRVPTCHPRRRHRRRRYLPPRCVGAPTEGARGGRTRASPNGKTSGKQRLRELNLASSFYTPDSGLIIPTPLRAVLFVNGNVNGTSASSCVKLVGRVSRNAERHPPLFL